jgi:hypothetical protein
VGSAHCWAARILFQDDLGVLASGPSEGAYSHTSGQVSWQRLSRESAVARLASKFAYIIRAQQHDCKMVKGKEGATAARAMPRAREEGLEI